MAEFASVFVNDIHIITCCFDIDNSLLRSNEADNAFVVHKLETVFGIFGDGTTLEIVDELFLLLEELVVGLTCNESVKKYIGEDQYGETNKKHLGEEFQERGREHEAKEEVGEETDHEPLADLPQKVFDFCHGAPAIDENKENARDGSRDKNDSTNDGDAEIRMLFPEGHRRFTKSESGSIDSSKEEHKESHKNDKEQVVTRCEKVFGY